MCHQSGLMHTVTGVSSPRRGKRGQPSKREKPMVLRKKWPQELVPKIPSHWPWEPVPKYLALETRNEWLLARQLTHKKLCQS